MNGSIRKRSKNSWELTIHLGHDGQGKRLRKYVNVKGLRADADRRLRELLAAADKGMPLDSSKVTVAEYLKRWYDDYVVPNTRPRTAERYMGDIRNHLIPRLGDLPLTKIRPNDVQSFEASSRRGSPHEAFATSTESSVRRIVTRFNGESHGRTRATVSGCQDKPGMKSTSRRCHRSSTC